jgi:hypothetical protein
MLACGYCSQRCLQACLFILSAFSTIRGWHSSPAAWVLWLLLWLYACYMLCFMRCMHPRVDVHRSDLDPCNIYVEMHVAHAAQQGMPRQA